MNIYIYSRIKREVHYFRELTTVSLHIAKGLSVKGLSVFRHFCICDNCKFQTVCPVSVNSRTLYTYIYMTIHNRSLDYSEDALRFRFQGNTRYRIKRSVDNIICILTAKIQARTRKISRGELRTEMEFLPRVF